MKILMIDNYDSFTFNLVQYLGELGAEVEVARNDQIDLDAIRDSDASRIMISPGPCTPNEAGISMAAIEAMAGERPVLGVCLGTRASARCLVDASYTRAKSCTARHRRFVTSARAFFEVSKIRSSRLDTTRW